MLDKYLGTLKNENTKKTYEKAISDMLSYIGKDYKDVNDLDLIDYKQHLINDMDYSDSTIQTKLRAIDSFYGWLYNSYQINHNPTVARNGKELRLGKSIEPKRKKTYIPMERAIDLIKVGKNTRDKAIIAVYLTTGIRVSELINLTLGDYKKKHTVIVTKGRKNRDILFNETACRYIDEYLKYRKDCDYDNLFISNQNTPMSVCSLNNTLKVLAKRANLPTDITNHQLRHSVITYAVKNSDIETARRFIGHSTCAMTAHYTHSTNDEVSNLSKAISF